MTLNWINIISARQVNALKMKVFDLNIETPKYQLEFAIDVKIKKNGKINLFILKMTDKNNVKINLHIKVKNLQWMSR